MSSNPPTDPLLSLDQAAVLLGVSVRTLRRAIADGRLPAYRVGAKPAPGHRDVRLIRVRPADLTALLEPVNGGAL